MKSLTRGLLVLVAVLALNVSPALAVLQIQFSGMDWAYDGTNLCDATTCTGSSGTRAESDPFFTMSFIVDGNPVGTLVSNIWFDSSIVVGALPISGSTTGSGGFFDILTQNTRSLAGGWR